MANWRIFSWEVSADGHYFEEVETETNFRHRKVKSLYITAGYPANALTITVGGGEVSTEEKHAFDKVRQEQYKRKVRWYAPLEQYPELYKTFAATETSKQGVLDFANQYGLLYPRGGFEDLHEVVTEHLRYDVHAELLSDWYNEINTMRRAVELWETVKDGNVDALKRLIVWHEDGAVSYHFPETVPPGWEALSRRLIAVPRGEYEFFYKNVVPGEDAKAARYYLQQTANEKLAGKLSSALLWDSGMDRLGLYHMPRDLLSAMWLQFADALTGTRARNKCVVCNEPLPVNQYGARRDKLYCSDACKHKAYRERKKAAARAG